jgi:regulator of protease activity HflC (stomatin/prohibitin superfamily)
MKKRVIFLGAALLLVAVGCTRQRTEANEWGCSFGKGPIEQTRQLKGRLAPGEGHGYSNDKLVSGPSDVRFYNIDKDPGTADLGALPIRLPARGTSVDGVGFVEVETQVQVKFLFNERFCDWYVAHGKRNEPLNFNAAAGQPSGWNTHLNVTINQKLIEGTRPVVRDVDYVTLYTNGKITVTDPTTGKEVSGLAYDVLAGLLTENLTRELRKDLGDDYFCGPSYKFDGKIDGELENGCPALEVTIKKIEPVDPKYIERLNNIVANEEEQKKIESDTELANKTAQEQKERAIAAADAARLTAENKATNDAAIAQAEAQRDEDIQVAQAKANEAIQVAQAKADLEIQLAQLTTQEQARLQQAAIDLQVARALAEVSTQNAANKTALQVAEATFCVKLAEVGVDCALLEAAENSNYPQYNLGGGTGSGTTPTVVLDARP